MEKFRKRLAFLARRRRFETELEEETRFHLELKTQEGVEAGAPEEEARYRAWRQFGNVVNLRERSRDVWVIAAAQGLMQDLRFAVRMLRKSPGFTAVSLAGLGLGIALSTTIFTLVNAILLRSYQRMKDPATYVSVFKSNHEGFSYFDYAYLRDHNTALSTLTAWSGRTRLIWSGGPWKYGVPTVCYRPSLA